MNRNSGTNHVDDSNKSTRSEAWLFAQAILGKPIPNPSALAGQAKIEREQLEWLAEISTRHQAQLPQVRAAEAQARHDRESLEWLALISDRHERQLRDLLREEAEEREAQWQCERFTKVRHAQEAQWNPDDHPRRPKGEGGGQWVAKGGGGGGTTSIVGTAGTQRWTPPEADRVLRISAARVTNGAAIECWTQSARLLQAGCRS